MASHTFIESGKLKVLLSKADPMGEMKVWIHNDRITLGADPYHPSLVVDLSAEKLLPFNGALQTPTSDGSHKDDLYTLLQSIHRRGSECWFELSGERHMHYSRKSLLKAALLGLEAASPGTLEKLSSIKLRSRRIVANDPKQLFENPRLVAKYAEQLSAGWWVGTNNSTPEVESWLKRAVECARLRWKKDFNVGW